MIQKVDEDSAAYIRTLNLLFLLNEKDIFQDMIVARLFTEAYRDEAIESVLALLVFALDPLAIGGVTGQPTCLSNGEFSGFVGKTNQGASRTASAHGGGLAW